MKKLLALLVIFTVFACALNAKDNNLTTTVFNVNPPMSCRNCENKIKSNLRFEKGVKEIVTSLAGQTVTVTYDTKKTDIEKLKKGFVKIDYTATVSDGSKPAGSPASCTGTSKCGNAVKDCCKDVKDCCCKNGAKNCCKDSGKNCDKKCDKK